MAFGRNIRLLRARVRAFAFFSAILSLFFTSAQAAPIRIVAIGASNTSGWLISSESAYPAVLQRLLKEKGIAAEVINAGVPFDTTRKMLERLDASVPKGTAIVILQPGGNDLRFFGTREERTANIERMSQRLKAKGIEVVVYDEYIPWKYVFDGIHLTPAGPAMIANALLPRVMGVIRRNPKLNSGSPEQPAAPGSRSKVERP
jgi:acyl-CoA thioesterase-1